MGQCTSVRDPNEAVSSDVEEYLGTHITAFFALARMAHKKNAESRQWESGTHMLLPQADDRYKSTIKMGKIPILETDPETEGGILKEVLKAVMKTGVKLTNNLADFDDSKFKWASPAVAQKEIEELCGNIRPPILADWSIVDVHSDELFTLLATQGFMAEFVTKNGDGFVARSNVLRAYEVRDGLERQGADVFFDAQMRLQSIDLGGTVVKPGDTPEAKQAWKEAKFVARSSFYTMTSLRGHFAHAHYTWSNYLAQAVVKFLAPNHPVRRLLHPHTYMTADVNRRGSGSLYVENGLFHRGFAFTYPALERLLTDFHDNFKFRTVPQMAEEAGLLESKIEAPYFEDGVSYYETLLDYVVGYLDLYYQDDAACLDACREFYEGLSGILPNGLPELQSKKQFAGVLATFVWSVTGYHEHVGKVVEFSHPEMMAPKWRKGETVISPQAMAYATVLACMTGLRLPGLMADYSHVFLDDKAKQHFKDFHEKCHALAATINDRNKSRKLQFLNFDPYQLEVSISV